jgi:glycosyltransferase involved in cell wall biosynthesis
MLTIPNLLATWTRNAISNSKLLVENFPIDYLRVGIAARQVSGKGILESIKSLDDSQDQLPIIELTIIGQETKESVGWSKRGLYGSHVVNAIESDYELCEWFTSLDLYLMPSTAWESQPNSLLEAIAIGCPVIVSDSIEFSLDLPDTLRFNSKSSQDLIAAINGIAKLGSPEILKITGAARTNLDSVYNEENAINKWLEILEV